MQRGKTVRVAPGVAAMLALGCAGGTAVTADTPDGTGTVEDELISPMVQRLFDEAGVVPGMAVAVVRDTSVVLLRGYGVADIASRAAVTPSTPFYIASSTKSFTATAAAILAEEGVWELDDPLRRWIPEIRLPEPLTDADVTLRSLLAHTSRLDNDAIVFRTAYSGEHDRATLIDLVARSEVVPQGFDYGNLGYVLTSLAMDEAVEGSWKEVLDRRIFDRLGMTRTSAYRSAFDDREVALPHGVGSGTTPFDIRPYIKVDANMHAAGGMITTVADLARWLEANLNEGRLDGREVLPAAAVREAHRLQTRAEASFFEFSRVGYGLGWYHGRWEDELLMHQFGNYPGFRAHVSFMPQHGLGVAVLTNESAQGYFLPEMAATLIYAALLDRPDLDERLAAGITYLHGDARRVRAAVDEDREQRASRSDTLVIPTSAYVGTYVNPELGTLRIEQAPVAGLLARIGRLESRMEPWEQPDLLRVELIPGNGQGIRFDLSRTPSPSLQYDGYTFVRR